MARGPISQTVSEELAQSKGYEKRRKIGEIGGGSGM